MQSRNKMLAAALSIAAAGFVFPAHAQYTGPADKHAATVSTILQQPKDDQDVVVQGRLLRKTGHEKYLFSDGTGEIIVEIDDDDMPTDPVDEKTMVELRGEVDTGRNRPPEIDVDSVTIIR